MILLLYEVFIVVALCYVFHQLLQWRKSKLPPGPMGIPVFGNLIQMGTRPHVPAQKWAKKYGKIFSLRMGPQTHVVINDLLYAKQIGNDPIFNGRMNLEIMEVFSQGKYGLFGSEGPKWEEQRRFALRHLRDYGLGKQTMANLILDEVNETLEKISRKPGSPIEIRHYFNVAAFNALWTIISGDRYSQDDPNLHRLMESFQKAHQNVQDHFWTMFVPWAPKLFPQLTGWNTLKRILQDFHFFVDEAIANHEKTGVVGSPRDFIDACLQQLRDAKDPESAFYGEAGRKNMRAMLGDFLQAGSLTVSTVIVWTIEYLLLHPDVGQSMQEEIDRVIGSDRQPSFDDQNKMPYCDAVIWEVLRIVTLVPLSGFHIALQEKEFNGYVIPKHTLYVINQEFIHKDPKIWGDPENFRPDRFLAPDKAALKQSVLAFSTGKHACPGERVARDSIFLFLTNILQKFDMILDPESPPTLEWDISFFIKMPKPFRVIFKERNTT